MHLVLATIMIHLCPSVFFFAHIIVMWVSYRHLQLNVFKLELLILVPSCSSSHVAYLSEGRKLPEPETFDHW